jgi:L-seryl-tRNA(Ser) seleniumtransferase
MSPPADPAAKMQRDSPARFRGIPSVDELLARPLLVALAARVGRGLVVQSARTVLADLRDQLRHDPAPAVLSELRHELERDLPARHTASASDIAAALDPAATRDAATSARDIAAAVDPAALESRIAAHVETLLAPSLIPVINATGVILHTNLGRAPISAAIEGEIALIATRYSNLEYDLETGERGKRDVHTARLLAQLVGAEAAIVVNNNAAAVFLVLNTLAKGAEVVVSRGELIEIGDGFRIPDIMSESGAVLREVGTTNRTRIRDYERAVNERTRLLLRVHPSNFRITGFTERPSLDEIAALGRRLQVPVYEDLGSGCLADLSANGINEPVARASCDAGVDVVSFSGDKLLGGPQAGIIAGKREFIDRIRRNPLFRALRVDKLTIAALEITLNAYLRGALDEIPALRMIRLPADEIARRAGDLAANLRSALANTRATIETRPGFSVVGGGSTPDQQLPTHLISISSPQLSSSTLESRLRKPATGPPVIARIEDDRVVLDLRTVFPDQDAALAAALSSALD